MRVKKHVRHFLFQLGLYYPVNLVRAIPDIVDWLRSGCHGVAPQRIKMMVVMSYLKRFSMDEFVETGTNYGDMLAYISRTGVRCRSIELSRELYKGARVRFNDHKNVTLLQGDSAQKLPEILKDINTPALFWLDGHYSGGNTASGVKSTPIFDELQAILGHPVKKHVILIDDARFFDGNHDYPKLDELLLAIREDARYSAEVSTDIIRIVPRAQ